MWVFLRYLERGLPCSTRNTLSIIIVTNHLASHITLGSVNTIDPKSFNASYENMNLEQVTTPSGTKYTISLDATFTNPLPITISPLSIHTSFWIYYQSVPILHIFTRPFEKLKLVSGFNSMGVNVISVPENTLQLMKMIGLVSDGHDVSVIVKDIALTGSGAGWMNDVVEKLVIPVTIPGASADDVDNSLVQQLLSSFGSASSQSNVQKSNSRQRQSSVGSTSSQSNVQKSNSNSRQRQSSGGGRNSRKANKKKGNHNKRRHFIR